VKLDFRRFDLQLEHTWTIARTEGADVIPVIIVYLTDTDGAMGLGEAAPVTRYDESVGTVEAFFRTVDPKRLSFEDIRGSMSYLDTLSFGDMSAKCALNTALLDGVAKRSRKSVCDFLGLSFQENRHTTSFTIGIDKPEIIQKKVMAAQRYPVLKMKVGGRDDKVNLQILREVAPLKPIRLDANEGWNTKEQALEMIEWMARDPHIEFVEQPMPAATPVRDWAWLKQRSPVPIFADESYHLGAEAEQVAQCFHGVNVKLVKSGGVNAALEALQAARRAGLKTMLGCMIETSVLITAAAHLAELCDYMDLDGNLLITNDPYVGVTAKDGMLSFATTQERFGLQVRAREHPDRLKTATQQ
jgi:L-Ala-D/L-Glu epimerase